MNPSRFRIVTVGLMLYGTLPVLAVASAADKVPLPTEDEIIAATKRMDAKFGREIVRARNNDAKEGVCEKLEDELKKLDDPADEYVLHRKIISLSVEIEQPLRIARQLDEIERRFEGDVLSVQADVIRKIPKKLNLYRFPYHFDCIADNVIKQVNGDRYDVATEFVKLATDDIKRFKQTHLRKAVEQLNLKVRNDQQEFDAIADARKKLADDAKDATSALAVGRFYCFVRKNWAMGLPLLAKGSDPQLAQLATRELENPKTSEARVKLANEWSEYGATVDGAAKELSRRQARRWYRLALREIENAIQIADITRKIDKLETQLQVGPIPLYPKVLFSFERGTWNQGAGNSKISDLSGNDTYIKINGTEIGVGKAGDGISIQNTKAIIVNPLSGSDAMTLCVWVYVRHWEDTRIGDYIIGDFNYSTTDLSVRNRVIQQTGPSGSGIRFTAEFASFTIAAEGKWYEVRTKPSIPYETGQWYHLAATFDGDQLKIYVNGQMEGQGKYKGIVNFGFVEAQLGGIFGNSRAGFDGILDEVAAYGRTLSADEIDTFYLMGVQGKHFAR